jgi:putative transcriptional regulator
MRRTPQTKIIRQALDLTLEEFSARYHIPLKTLRDWEQGRSEPDQTARAYLCVIAAEPDVTAKALADREFADFSSRIADGSGGFRWRGDEPVRRRA